MAQSTVFTLLHHEIRNAFVRHHACHHLFLFFEKMAMQPARETGSRLAYAGRKLEQLAGADGFAKGAWGTGKTIYASGQVISPWVARAAGAALLL